MLDYFVEGLTGRLSRSSEGRRCQDTTEEIRATVSHRWEMRSGLQIQTVSDAVEQGVSVADKDNEKKLKQSLKSEVIKDPKLGKPTDEKLKNILDRANKKK